MSRPMKDSGIEWIGEIPENWNNQRLRFLCDIQTGNMDTQDHNPNGIYPFYVRSPIVEHSDSYTFDNEAVLMAGDGVGAGKVFHYVKGKYGCHQRVYSMSNLHINGKFLFYYLSEIFYKKIEASNAKSTVDSVRLPMLKDFHVVFPDESQQERIVQFLDRQCALIDSVIEKTKTTIEEYKKLRQAVITQAVTKGIRGNRPMKDSGSVWFGTIPLDWTVKRIKYQFHIKKDIAGKEGYTVLSITQKGIIPKDLSKNEGQLAESYSNYQIVNIGDFAMNHMDLLTGWVDISKYSGVTSPDYRVFVLDNRENSDSHYFLYMMQMCYSNRIFYGLGQGVSGLGRWRLQADKFLNFLIPIPPLQEQQEIASYLDKKCAEIDTLITKKEQILKELESYKKSLIYEYVTGKKEVQP